MDETLKEIGELIAASRPGAVVEWHVAYGELTVVVVAVGDRRVRHLPP